MKPFFFYNWRNKMKPFFYKTTDGRIVKKEDGQLSTAGALECLKDLTPIGEKLNCGVLHYKLGDTFKTLCNSSYYKAGDVWKLVKDDGSAKPHFKKVYGHELSNATCWIELENIVPTYVCEAEMKLRKALKVIGVENVPVCQFKTTYKDTSNVDKKPSKLLAQAFDWSDSAEGFDHWSEVHDNLKACEKGRKALVNQLNKAGLREAVGVLPEFIKATHGCVLIDLRQSFTWCETPQGVDYWRSVYTKLIDYTKTVEKLRTKVLDAMKKVGYVDVTLPEFTFSSEDIEERLSYSAADILHGAFVFPFTPQGFDYWHGVYMALARSASRQKPCEKSSEEPSQDTEEKDMTQKITMDGKYKTKTGKPVRILCVDRKHSTYPVVALVSEDSGVEATKAYTAEGFYYGDKTEHDSNLVPVKEEVFTRDQLVEVSDSGVSWTKAHFSHKTGEAFHVFADGRTSHTNKGSLPWNYCRAA
jgi:hypothetical protein